MLVPVTVQRRYPGDVAGRRGPATNRTNLRHRHDIRSDDDAATPSLPRNVRGRDRIAPVEPVGGAGGDGSQTLRSIFRGAACQNRTDDLFITSDCCDHFPLELQAHTCLRLHRFSLWGRAGGAPRHTCWTKCEPDILTPSESMAPEPLISQRCTWAHRWASDCTRTTLGQASVRRHRSYFATEAVGIAPVLSPHLARRRRSDRGDDSVPGNDKRAGQDWLVHPGAGGCRRSADVVQRSAQPRRTQGRASARRWQRRGAEALDPHSPHSPGTRRSPPGGRRPTSADIGHPRRSGDWPRAGHRPSSRPHLVHRRSLDSVEDQRRCRSSQAADGARWQQPDHCLRRRGPVHSRGGGGGRGVRCGRPESSATSRVPGR